MLKLMVLGSRRHDLRALPPGESVRVVSLIGSQSVDLTQLAPSTEQVRLELFVAIGSIIVLVPPGVAVLDGVSTVLGSTALPRERPSEPPAFTLRLGGLVCAGSVVVRIVR